MPNTFADFWRMVWEQGTIVIIMITNLIERGRRKCDMYWPEEGSETYGSVTVKHINTFSRAHFTVRMFSLKNAKNKKVCEIYFFLQNFTESISELFKELKKMCAKLHLAQNLQQILDSVFLLDILRNTFKISVIYFQT